MKTTQSVPKALTADTDMATLEAMYHSPEYQEAMQHRQAASQARFLAVETLPESLVAPDANVKASH